jgi:hypothetical protein
MSANASAPPSYGQPATRELTQAEKITKFNDICTRYEVSEENRRLLMKYLTGCEIVMLIDDSSSMTEAGSYIESERRTISRWEEVRRRIIIVMELACIFDPDGIDLYFLNRPAIANVTDVSQVHAIFANQPYGTTPLTSKFKKIIADKQSVIRERNLLIIIPTDGVPTTESISAHGSGNGMKQFARALANRSPIDKIFVSIMACTDDESVLRAFRKIDKNIKNSDFTDDYDNEKASIRKVMGKSFIFTHGDYIAKTILGPMCDEMNSLNDPKMCTGCTIL